MTLHRFLALFCLGLVIVSAFALWFVPPAEDFQPDNPFWNGSQHFARVAGVNPVDSFAGLPALPEGATLIVIPYREFSGSELEALNHFATDGGILILADDFGRGNQVLENLGLKPRFSRKVLLDPLFHYKNRKFPRADVTAGDPFTAGLEHFNLNYATAIEGADAGSVLVESSSFSFLDSNGNGSPDEGEPVGRQAVMTRQLFGKGQVVLLGDPSIFINGMLSGDNLKLAENIAGVSKSGLYFDRSHLMTSNLREAKDGLRTVRDFALKAPISVALVLGVIAVTLVPVWHKARKENSGSLPGEE